MGIAASTSYLLPEEVTTLTSLSSDTPWPYDSEGWLAAFHYKYSLDTIPVEHLLPEIKTLTARLLRNAHTSGNLVTLACHVASRLPRAWYFSSTDVELTVNAVVLLRLLVTHMWHEQALSSQAHPTSTHASTPLSPSSSITLGSYFRGKVNRGATANAEVDAFNFDVFIASIMDFLATAPLNDALWELHTQVLTLFTVLLASQMYHTDVLTAVDVLTTASKSPHSFNDPALLSALALGRTTQPRPASAHDKDKSGKPAKVASRADALVGALIRNICEDAVRDEDAEPGPSDSSTASTASIKVQMARRKAYEGRDGSGKPQTKQDGVLDSVVSAATKVASMPGSLVSSILPGDAEFIPRPLAERSAIVLLVLTHNCRSGIDESSLPAVNPFRYALTKMVDIDNPLSMLPAGETPKGDASIRQPLPVKFKGIFSALTQLCASPLGTALLYTLLHASTAFTDYLLTRSDVDELLLASAFQLYHIDVLDPNHRYLLLITLILFSQDGAWCETAHRRIKISPKSIGWFRDRLLGEITLGSFLWILLTRIILNSSGALPAATTASAGYGTDDYLHTNCLAVLTNMAPYVEGLHPYAAQRTVSLLALLHKRYKRVLNKLTALQNVVDEYEAARRSRAPVPAAMTETATNAGAEYKTLASIADHYERSIRMTIDILQACCAPSVLPSNVALLYTLLREKDAVLQPLAEDPGFVDVMPGLMDIAQHFGGVLKGEGLKRAGSNSPTAVQSPAVGAAAPQAVDLGTPKQGQPAASVVWEESEVSEILSTAARSWRGGAAAAQISSSLKESKFAYEEDPHPELFFVPYVWSLSLNFLTDCGWSYLEDPASHAMVLLPPNSTALYTNVNINALPSAA